MKFTRKNTRNSKFRLAVLCGGPSLERGISLNSARSVCDHLDSKQVEIIPIYFDHRKRAHQISRAELYSSTPSDFDFKLRKLSRPLFKTGLKKILKTVDLTFPAIHGRFGEDGDIQKMLEAYGVPFIGSSSEACRKCFDKYDSNEMLKQHGFKTVPTLLLKSHRNNWKNAIEKFFRERKISRAVVKPARGGSSIGVFSVNSVKEALDAVKTIFAKRMDTRMVIQPFLKGTEFTVILLENRFGNPVAAVPTEIEVDYQENQIFDYRKKYLATRQVAYHCPPRFSETVIEKIQIQAEQLFKLFGMHDFARFDGWMLDSGEVYFSDFNPVSGMEQNSFLFQQASQIGMSHQDCLHFVIKSACKRYNIKAPKEKATERKPSFKKKSISVLFGGDTAERQVSVMSGTNVWLKLRRCKEYDVQPFLLDTQKNVWRLPYFLALNHTVEEIVESAKRSILRKNLLDRLRHRVHIKLALEENDATEAPFLPEKMPLKKFINQSDFIFLGLHGGMGENGAIQKMLEQKRKPFNGSDSKTSRLCMDKFETGIKLQPLENEGIFIAPKKLVALKTLQKFSDRDFLRLWRSLKREFHASTVIVKPARDGCSAGVARLFTSADLKKYITLAFKNVPRILANTFGKQSHPIEMPTKIPSHLLFEKFIETDTIHVTKKRLHWRKKTGWIEITAGVIGRHAMNPSITVTYGDILTLEEKFQGGTGINITPPPERYVKPKIVETAKKRIERVVQILNIKGYARIDAFLNIHTGEIIVIEANTLPGLTPSTVIFHQALQETPKMYPTPFLKKIVEFGMKRYDTIFPLWRSSGNGKIIRAQPI